jgi:DNA polymerase-4
MINKELPMIMHIDLNCCFAIIEQQANKLLRGRPVAVSAYDTPRGMVLASSYEAKRLGVKLGVNNGEARKMAPGIVILTPDPSKYREAHKRFNELLLDFTPDVAAKSIDEFVLNFSGAPSLRGKERTFDEHCARMEEIGLQIKERVRERLGEWVTVNIGIGTNRFLAKYGAGFGKPDGMTLISHKNIEAKYEGMQLVDLPGINVRYGARLMACGIMNPLQFYQADERLLKKVVFKSVVGYYWWARLRGHEVDDRTFKTKSIGHQYALPKKTTDKKELERLLMKLCEKVGRRLRKKNFCARGIHLYLGFAQISGKDGVESSEGSHGSPVGFDNIHRLRSWHEGHRLDHRMYATSDIYEAGKYLLARAEIVDKVKIMAITVYDLEPWDPEQLTIFSADTTGTSYVGHGEFRPHDAARRLSDAMDTVNTRYGEFVITPGTMMDMKGEILDRIAFSSTPQD